MTSETKYSQEELDKSYLVFLTGRVSQEKKERKVGEARGGLVH